MADKVYRLKLSKQSSNSSMGDWRYYESENRFLADLLTAAIEDLVEKETGRSNPARSAWRRWLDLKGRTYSHAEQAFHASVVGADVLVDNEWQPVKWLLHPPSIEVLP